MKPFLKWAGGKMRLLPELLKYVPETYESYIEPFLGGGAMFFALLPRKALLADRNEALITTYRVVKSDDLVDLMRALDAMSIDEKTYKWAACLHITKMADFMQAVYFIYLNKTAFNGLYRVNNTGKYNVPFGSYKNPKLYDLATILSAHRALNQPHVHLHALHFKKTLNVANIGTGDFIYVDPPYHGGFTAYTAEGFTEQDQIDLARICADLAGKGCHILASNSNTDFIRQTWGQYGCFDIHEVMAPRSISCKGDGRGKVKELIITNVRKGKDDMQAVTLIHVKDQRVKIKGGIDMTQEKPTASPWRLPTVVELTSLLDYSKPNQAIWLNSQGFVEVQAAFYWSSTTYAGGTYAAWIVNVGGGYVVADGKSGYYYYAWPVRSGHLPFGDSVVEACGRFTDNGDGSITDNLTGLEWAKDRPGGRLIWQEAMDYVARLNEIGLFDNTGKVA